MTIAPILILGFKRPENVLKIIEAIRPQAPGKVYFAVDGPRPEKTSDFLQVAKTQSAIESIDWECEVYTRFRETNLGLRRAIPDAVSWVLMNEDRLIVIEDDAIPGPQVLQFMSSQLSVFEEDDSIFHISGYNLVPVSEITNPDYKTRASRYPESYLWGSWSRAWKHYRDDLSGSQEFVKSSDLNYKEKLIWRLNFKMAELDLINTWAYRWIYSIWINEGKCISPNRNLTKYVGQVDGTHTKRKTKVNELSIAPVDDLEDSSKADKDFLADTWISRNVFHANPLGLMEQVAAFLVLHSIRLSQKLNPKKINVARDH